jgi:cation diffusion facilitator family transporter
MENHSSVRAIFYAFLANLGIGVTKLGAAIYTGSGSMLAEAIHSFADTTNQILLFVGLKRAKRPPDEKHPLGYGKTIYFWSFLVAILLFSMGGIFSIYEGIHKLESQETLESGWIALVVLGISIILETFSFLGALREIRLLKKDMPLMQWLRESTNAELIVVFWEDVAALVGLCIAFVFVFLSYYLHNPFFDALGSICIGILLVIISIIISIRIKSMLIGESTNRAIKNQILQIIQNIPEVESVFRVIAIQLGPEVMLASKVKLRSNLSIQQAIEVINQLEKQIKQQIPEIKWIFIEPDTED